MQLYYYRHSLIESSGPTTVEKKVTERALGPFLNNIQKRQICVFSGLDFTGRHSVTIQKDV